MPLRATLLVDFMDDIQRRIELLGKRIEQLGEIAMQSSSAAERRNAECEIRALQVTINYYKQSMTHENFRYKATGT